MQETEAYITIKGQKGFPNKISCHLINPSKTSIENSEVILDKIKSRFQIPQKQVGLFMTFRRCSRNFLSVKQNNLKNTLTLK